MMTWLKSLLRRETPALLPPKPQISADDVETAIEAAGRAEVFALAAQNGWTPSNPPPMWVWMQIAHEVKRQRASAVSVGTVH